MNVKIDNMVFLTIFEKGIDNSEFFNKRKEGICYVKNLLKIFRIFFYGFFFKSIKKLNLSSVLLAWYPLHENILSQYNGEKVALLAQKNSLNSQTFLSYISLKKLLRLRHSIPKDLKNKGLMYDWYFFNAIYIFLAENSIKSIIIAGHYDKYATWLSYLSKELGIHFTISQHGANSKYDLPYKIPADRVEVFSKAEEEMFRSTILNSEDAVFYIKGFKTSLTFTKGEFQNRTIAIASQPNYEERVIDLIRTIVDIDDSINIIVYSHPSDLFRKGVQSLDKMKNCCLTHHARYWDIDYLIVFTSTLAYDYWSCSQFTGRVLCFFDDKCIVALYNDERGIVIYPETFQTQLKTILERTYDER